MPDKLAEAASNSGFWAAVTAIAGAIGLDLKRRGSLKTLSTRVKALEHEAVTGSKLDERMAEFERSIIKAMGENRDRIMERIDERYDSITGRLDRHLDSHK